MSSLPINLPRQQSQPSLRRFWQRLAHALDEYFAERSKRAVPATILRRSHRELTRCRRLMHRAGETGLGVLRWPERGLTMKGQAARFRPAYLAQPPLQSICTMMAGDEPAVDEHKPLPTAHTLVKFPARPESHVLSNSIPLFFHRTE